MYVIAERAAPQIYFRIDNQSREYSDCGMRRAVFSFPVDNAAFARELETCAIAVIDDEGERRWVGNSTRRTTNQLPWSKNNKLAVVNTNSFQSVNTLPLVLLPFAKS